MFRKSAKSRRRCGSLECHLHARIHLNLEVDGAGSTRRSRYANRCAFTAPSLATMAVNNQSTFPLSNECWTRPGSLPGDAEGNVHLAKNRAQPVGQFGNAELLEHND